jgi:group I intron endonuclease
MHYLYKITDTLNNKVYIGQSNKETERWRQHKYLARQDMPIQYVHRAMKKYDIENFTYEVIAMCKTQEDADQTEMLLIKQYDSHNKDNGYNVALGGDHAWNAGLLKEQQPMFGKHHTEESKLKSSISNTGKKKPKTEEWRKQMSEAHKGQVRSPEAIKKMLETKSKNVYKATQATKDKISKSRAGITSGENHPRALLTWEIVRNMRKDSENGMRQCDISRKYGVCKVTVRQVVKYLNWIESVT